MNRRLITNTGTGPLEGRREGMLTLSNNTYYSCNTKDCRGNKAEEVPKIHPRISFTTFNTIPQIIIMDILTVQGWHCDYLGGILTS